MMESAFDPSWSRRRGGPIYPGIPIDLCNHYCYCSLISRNLAGGHRPGDETALARSNGPGEFFLLFPCRLSHRWQVLARNRCSCLHIKNRSNLSLPSTFRYPY
ncbi:unnamed protein product [Ectocarpus sp. 13 AM-2016]